MEEVKAIEIKDGLSLIVHKDWFMENLINNKGIAVVKLFLDFEVSISKITEHEVFITFKQKH